MITSLAQMIEQYRAARVPHGATVRLLQYLLLDDENWSEKLRKDLKAYTGASLNRWVLKESFLEMMISASQPSQLLEGHVAILRLFPEMVEWTTRYDMYLRYRP